MKLLWSKDIKINAFKSSPVYIVSELKYSDQVYLILKHIETNKTCVRFDEYAYKEFWEDIKVVGGKTVSTRTTIPHGT